MNQVDFTQNLQNLMARVGISSFKSLSCTSGVSESQIRKLRQGKLEQMRIKVLLKLATVLHISLSELVVNFSVINHQYPDAELKVINLQREYDRLLVLLARQREELEQDFQESSLQILESLLLFWPTAAQRAREDPLQPAINIVPLVQKPLDKLLQSWGVEAIAEVGAEIPYNPQFHQLLEGTLSLGETVKVRYIGYRKGNKLLYRAKVIPL
jgi:DNA-binding Xre family transcriptional regulator